MYATLGDIPRHARIRKGMAVETSGFSAVFPAGLFVGNVAGVENSEDGVIDPATPLTGEIGFLLYNPSGDAIAYFDNLKLVPEADYTPPEILGAIDDPDDKPDDKPGENPGDDNKDPEPTGCGGNVAAVSAVSAVTILSAACVVLLRKKKD